MAHTKYHWKARIVWLWWQMVEKGIERLKKVCVLEEMWHVKLEYSSGDYVPWKSHKECTCEWSTKINKKLNDGSLFC